jgi:hypothetical protein
MNHLFALIAILVIQRRSIAGNMKQTDCTAREGVHLPKAWKAFALAIGICGLIDALPNTAHANRAAMSPQLATHACQTTMGLNASEAEYAACVSSLNHSLAAAYDSDEVSRNPVERACAEMGIRLRSAAFNKCVVDLSSSLFKLQNLPGR